MSNRGNISNKKFDNDEKYHWAMALAVKGIGRKTFAKIKKFLYKNRISWLDFWVGDVGLYHRIGLNDNIVKSIRKHKKEYKISSYKKELEKQQISVYSYKDVEYPQWLKTIEDKPPIIYVKGSLKIDQKIPIAVIGTRNITPYGRFVTKKIVAKLVRAGATIVSGFMYGVDVLAQEQALINQGKTIGVLGYGFNHIYPRTHNKILKQMLQSKNSAFISEYPPRTRPTKGTFPQRNRIIAGIALATVVIEAAENSGTQITVGYALDYGRDVFAIPGSITSRYSEGVKQMINQGAQLVTSGTDILENLSAHNWLDIKKGSIENKKKGEAGSILIEAQLDPVGRKVYNQLLIQMQTSDQIAESLGIPIQIVLAKLSCLELRGLIKHQANYWFVS
ncbi:MAG: DNA-processing protein DprA [Patescibacteria group bacterium]|nr:DNA-processing protein DprA [Patescibacteria group bacterium]